MATERLSMRRTRAILRQKLELGRSHREVAASVGLSVGAVSATLVRAAAAGLSWASVQGLTDEALDERLYAKLVGAGRPLPDCAYIHAERKKPGVTLELLHVEYLEMHPSGYLHLRRALGRREGHRGMLGVPVRTWYALISGADRGLKQIAQCNRRAESPRAGAVRASMKTSLWVSAPARSPRPDSARP